jgi:methionyl-tRNA synthetase
MSKSRKNVVDPDDLLKRYGADTARLFSLFAAPPEKDLEWSDKGVEGAFRFLNRVYRLVDGWADELSRPAAPIPFNDLTVGRAVYQKAHLTIKKVTEDLDRDFHFNTAIAALMELVNVLGQIELRGDSTEEAERRYVARFAMETLLVLLAPFAPHLAEELWERLARLRRRGDSARGDSGGGPGGWETAEPDFPPCACGGGRAPHSGTARQPGPDVVAGQAGEARRRGSQETGQHRHRPVVASNWLFGNYLPVINVE